MTVWILRALGKSTFFSESQVIIDLEEGLFLSIHVRASLAVIADWFAIFK